ncbi:phosphatases II [Tilletiaria anomala UBC 951]|uniref:Phosphatases II n=1 Tax=Tilletiaria anomala (strain ATCC 24038 / CBS 436.72 / UBC 951) TaxID=1037660 RepID=A0A066W4K9_TILAU|nr:phosphatases II [Tilletiaria anomala UBC 951]KDN48867.1 phosphatases II [Tilletiaria anomala UBC 951]
MDKLKIAKVDSVRLQRGQRHDTVTLHLTSHHFILNFDTTPAASTQHANNSSVELAGGNPSGPDPVISTKAKRKEVSYDLSEAECTELWIPYHLIAQLTRVPSVLPPSAQQVWQRQQGLITLPHSQQPDRGPDYPAYATPQLTQGLNGGHSLNRERKNLPHSWHPPYISSGRVFPLAVYLRNLERFGLGFQTEQLATEVFESVKACAILPSMDQLYAFRYKHIAPANLASGGWNRYDCKAEFARQGVGRRTKAWRFTDVNSQYTFCPTYPAQLVVPSRISDTTLNYAAKYRSKARIPALSYLHWANNGTITRSSQPMVGLNRNRSVQDEKLIEAVFTSHHFADPHSPAAAAAVSHGAAEDMSPNSGFPAMVGANLQAPSGSPSNRPPSASLNLASGTAPFAVYGAQTTNLIIDARPTTNAMANVAKGAGSENMDHYRGCKKAYLGVDNIHVMRDSLQRVVETLREADFPYNFEQEKEDKEVKRPPIDSHSLKRSSWLKHISALLEGSMLIARNVHINSSHVLIHCSDGWDRTSQLSAIAQISLDPYYRTLEGFAVLVEKDWLSFGHRFMDRCGHLSHEKFFTTAQGHGEPDNEDDERGDGDGGFEPVQAATALWGFTKSLAGNFSSGSGSGSHTHPKEMSPVFHQFLDCVWQIYRQFPQRFEFNSDFLVELHKQLYTCTFGTFLHNCEKDRRKPDTLGIPPAAQCSVSVWDYMFSTEMRPRWINEDYDKSLDDPKRAQADMGVLLMDSRDVRFFAGLFRRENEEMNAYIVAEIEERHRFREAELALAMEKKTMFEAGPSEVGGVHVAPAISTLGEDPALNPLTNTASIRLNDTAVTARDLGSSPFSPDLSGAPVTYKPYQPRQRPHPPATAAAAASAATSNHVSPSPDETNVPTPVAPNAFAAASAQAHALANSEGAQKMKTFFSAGWGRLQEAVNAQLDAPQAQPTTTAPSASSLPLHVPLASRPDAPLAQGGLDSLVHQRAASAARVPAPQAANPWASRQKDSFVPSNGLKDSTLLDVRRKEAEKSSTNAAVTAPAVSEGSKANVETDPLGVLG